MENLKEYRLECKLTQIYVARYCGVSLNAYIRWEQGVGKPNEEHLEKLKELFGNARL